MLERKLTTGTVDGTGRVSATANRQGRSTVPAGTHLPGVQQLGEKLGSHGKLSLG